MKKGIALIVAIGAVWTVAAQSTPVSLIRTNAASRAHYLARATIWRDPGALSPAEVLAGAQEGLPYSFEEATSDAGITCTFAKPGKELGGGTAKFLCRTAAGQNLRLKYWNPETGHGNREVFSTVAASRLIWALGFNAVPAVSMNVRCEGCPENPHEGTGELRTRRYLAMTQAPWPTPVIVSGGDINQGWSWKELDMAIRALPPGVERQRQRMYFDAWALLGVFMQHGDRKSEQQRLYCASVVDTTAGDVIATKADAVRPMLLEHAPACTTSAVAIVDVGSTFGGAGRTSSGTSAAMNLEEWGRRHVFVDGPDGNECRGDLTVSLKAGGEGEGNPLISEEGRRFLAEQLHRLTADHVRAIFRAARVDELASRSPHPSAEGIDAWVSVFQEKVRQIDARRCTN